MRSDIHQTLLRRLQGAVREIGKVAHKDELEGLPALLKTHQTILEELYQAGDCKDPALIPLMSEIHMEVTEIIEKSSQKQAELQTGLKAAANKRMLVRSYGRHMRPPDQ